MRGLRCARPRPACHRQSLLPHAPPRRFVWPPGFAAVSFCFSFFLQNFSHLLAQPLANFRPILTGSAAESNATNAVVAARVLDEGSCPSGGSAQESEARPLLTTGPCDLGLLEAYSWVLMMAATKSCCRGAVPISTMHLCALSRAINTRNCCTFHEANRCEQILCLREGHSHKATKSLIKSVLRVLRIGSKGSDRLHKSKSRCVQQSMISRATRSAAAMAPTPTRPAPTLGSGQHAYTRA